MSIKLICIDMDGTLLMDQHNISEEDKSAIKYAIEKGVHVAITTGRVYNCAKLYSDLIGLTTPIIASNGAFIGGSHGEEIYNNPLNIDDAEKADEYFSIFMGDEVEPRKNYIIENAKFAELDI